MAIVNPNIRGALFGLAAFTLFSCHDMLVKQLGGIYSPVQVLFFTALLGFPLAILLAMHDGKPATLRPAHPGWMLARSVSVVIAWLSAFYSFSVLPLTQVYAVIFATPLFITMLSIPFLGETVRFRRWTAVIVGLGGVIIVLRPGTADLGIGHIAALTCALAGAFNSIVVRRIGREERNVVLVLFPLLANFAVMGIALPLVYVPMPLTDLGLVSLVALLSFVAVLCLIRAYKSAEAVVVAPMQYSQIVWATVFGALLFAEIPDMPTLVGTAVIVTSGVYILLRENSGNHSTHQPVLRTRSRIGVSNGLRVGPLLRSSGKPNDSSGNGPNSGDS